MEQKKQPQDWRSFFLASPMLTALLALGLVFLIGMSIFAFVRQKPKTPAAPAQQTQQADAGTGDAAQTQTSETDAPGTSDTDTPVSEPAERETDTPAESDTEFEELPTI